MQVVATAGNDYTVDVRRAKQIAALRNRNDPRNTDQRSRVSTLQSKLRGLSKGDALHIARHGLIKNFPFTPEEIHEHWKDDGSQEAATIRRRSARIHPIDMPRGQPGDRVHFDAFTVSPPAVLHKYDLVYVFVDRATLATAVLFGRRKDKSVDVAQHIWRIDRLFRMHGHKILSLQSDNFTTYVAQEAQDAEWAMGIQRALKPPYLKEGLEESMVSAIKIIVRSCFAAAPYIPAPCWPYAVMRAVHLLGLRPSPGSPHMSRQFAFTGVHPDWNRNPIDDFGAPYLVWESKDQREHTFSASGQWAAYLCPSTDSLPEVHYFLVMRGKGQYSVVLRGSYARQAEIPEWWWADSPPPADVKIRIAGGNFCKEIDGRAFLSFDAHYPTSGTSEKSIQTTLSVPVHQEVIELSSPEIVNTASQGTQAELTAEESSPELAETVNQGGQVEPPAQESSPETAEQADRGEKQIELPAQESSPETAEQADRGETNYEELSETSRTSGETDSELSSEADWPTIDVGVQTGEHKTYKKRMGRDVPAVPPPYDLRFAYHISALQSDQNHNNSSETDDLINHLDLTEYTRADEAQPDGLISQSAPRDISTTSQQQSTSPVAPEAIAMLLGMLTHSIARHPKPKRLQRQEYICALNKTIVAAKKVGRERKAQKNKKNKKQGYAGDNPTLREALESTDAAAWTNAIIKELSQLSKMGSWKVLTEFPPGARWIPSHYVLKRKRKADGAIDKYKARLVAGGHRQLKSMYDKTTSPTASAEAVRLIYSIAAKLSLIVRQFDVTGAYLLAKLESPEPIYMIIPGTLNQPEMKVELLKSLYGLKQAGFLWNKLLDTKLREIGLVPTKADPCVYTLEKGDDHVIVAIHVDDLLFVSTNNDLVDQIVLQLRDKLGAELEETTHTGSHLGINMKRLPDGSIVLSQPGYISRMAETLGLTDGPPVSMPYLVSATRPADSPPVDETTFRQVLGLLMFAAVHTRPDIGFPVAQLATRACSPTEWDLQQAYKVVRYLYSTKELGLRYSAHGPVTMYAFVDAAYNLHEDSKGHSGILLTLGLTDAPFLARSKKQSLVTRSSTEAETYAVDQAVLDIEWFRLLLDELGYKQDRPTTVYQDNQSTIQILESGNYSSRTKHFAMRYHYVRQAMGEGSIVFEYLPTAEHTADIMTKALSSKTQFNRLRNKLLNIVS